MSSEEASKVLGIGLTVLKRICRKFGVKRWPYRKLKSLDRLINNVESGLVPGDSYKNLLKVRALPTARKSHAPRAQQAASLPERPLQQHTAQLTPLAAAWLVPPPLARPEPPLLPRPWPHFPHHAEC